MKREKVYIAGPVTGIERGKVEYEFNLWKSRLIHLGYDVVSPIDFIPADMEWNQAMEVCLFKLSQCQKALFIKGWFMSFGASMEMEFCILHGINILSPGMIKEEHKQKMKYSKGY